MNGSRSRVLLQLHRAIKIDCVMNWSILCVLVFGSREWWYLPLEWKEGTREEQRSKLNYRQSVRLSLAALHPTVKYSRWHFAHVSWFYYFFFSKFLFLLLLLLRTKRTVSSAFIIYLLRKYCADQNKYDGNTSNHRHCGWQQAHCEQMHTNCLKLFWVEDSQLPAS